MDNLTHTNNSLSEDVTFELDDLGLAEKLIYSIISAVFLAFGIIALICLNRTRSTPETAKFLSSGLILFDELAVVSFAIRKFIRNEDLNIFVQVFGVAWVYLAYITIGLMSMERLFIFCAPYVYLRKVTTTLVKTIVYTTWIICSIVYVLIRYGLCFIVYSDATMSDVIGRCNGASFALYGVCVIVIIFSSMVAYCKIVCIFKSQRKIDVGSTTLGTLRYYKSTSLVFVYIITITITSLSIMLIISLNLDKETVRVWTDIMNMVNCLFDPCTYILWYREARMEMLKLFACFNNKLYDKIEQMRMEIYGIVNIRGNNKVYPASEHQGSQYI